MDSAMPMAPSASAQLPFSITLSTTYTNEQFESVAPTPTATAATVNTELPTNIVLTVRADTTLKVGDYIRFGPSSAAGGGPANDVMKVMEVVSATEILVQR